MSKLVRLFLTLARIREGGGVYEGVIANVVMMLVNNKFAGAKVNEPTIVFTDGLHLIPSQSMRRDLVAMHGAETDGWRGLTIRIRAVAVEYTDRKTGERKVRYEKRVEDPDAAQQPAPSSAPERDIESRANVLPIRRDRSDSTDAVASTAGMLTADEIPWSGRAQ